MNISEIRLKNLTKIIDEKFRGVRADLARAINVAPNNISRYYASSARDKRSISDDTAIAIEDAIGKPRGWMSQEHDLSPLIERAISALQMLPEDAQEDFLVSIESRAQRELQRAQQKKDDLVQKETARQ